MSVWSNSKAAVRSAQLRQLFKESKAALVTSVLLAALLTYIQYDLIEPAVIRGWFGAFLITALLRAISIGCYRSYYVQTESALFAWLWQFRLGVVAIGLVWGASAYCLFPPGHREHQLFLIFVLAGLSAGGVAAFSADLFSATAFSLAVLVPIIVRLFNMQGKLFTAMALAGLLYLIFMLITLRRFNRNITQNIFLQLQAIAREEALRVSEERYRVLLNHSPVGINRVVPHFSFREK
jgi:PAS domain-containing protein